MARIALITEPSWLPVAPNMVTSLDKLDGWYGKDSKLVIDAERERAVLARSLCWTLHMPPSYISSRSKRDSDHFTLLNCGGGK